MALEEADDTSDHNLSKLSALISAFLNLWLSILLLGGAIVACITSQFVKFFALEPPCLYAGSIRGHCCSLEASRGCVKDERCGNCCFSESCWKSIKHKGHAAVSTGYIDPATPQILRPGQCVPKSVKGNDHPSYFDGLDAGDKDETRGLSRHVSHDSDNAYFLCSNCNSLLSFQKHRTVGRKVTGAIRDVCDQIGSNVTANTGVNAATKSCDAEWQGAFIGHSGKSTRLDASNSDTDSSHILPHTSKQTDRGFLTSPTSSRDLDRESIADCRYSSGSACIEDAWENVEGKNGEAAGKKRKELAIIDHEEARQVKDQQSQGISEKRWIPFMGESEKGMHAGGELVAIQKEDLKQDFSTLTSKNIESLQAKFKKQEEIIDNVEVEDLQEKREGGRQEESFLPGKKSQQKESIQVCSKEKYLQHSAIETELWQQMTGRGTENLEDHSDIAQQEDEDNHFGGIEGEGGVNELQEALRMERNALSVLYAELDEERNAAAIAAKEAMAMISRLQEEKAAMQMEAAHYQRLVEEKAIYDQQAMTVLKEILFNWEREKYALEQEVELYREKFPSGKLERMRTDRQKDGFYTEKKESFFLPKGTEKVTSPAWQGNEQCGERVPDNVRDPEIVDTEWKNTSVDENHNKRFRGLLLNDNETRQSPYSSEGEQLDKNESPLVDILCKTGLRESLNNVLLGSYPEEHMQKYLGRSSSSLKDDETQFVLERLQALEKQFRELVEKKETVFLKPVFPDRTSDSIVTLLGESILKEQLDGSSLDSSSCMHTRPSVTASEKGALLEVAVSCGSPTTVPCDGKFITDFTDALPTKEGPRHGDGSLSVHDVYEVQHELKHSRQHLFAWEGMDFLKNTEDKLGESDLSSPDLSQRSLLDAEYSKNQSLGTIAKARMPSSSQDRTSRVRIAKEEPNNWDGEAKQYPISDHPLDVQQHAFRTESMIFRDIKQRILQGQAASLNKRPQDLQSDREILTHTLSLGSLKKKDIGADLLQEFLQRLQELNMADTKTNDTGESLRYLEPLSVPSFEMHIPAIKKQRYSSELWQNHASMITLPGIMGRYNSM